MTNQDANESMTFEQMAAVEPGLLQLADELRAIKDEGGPSFCANYVWYRKGYRDRMYALVGWEAENDDPRLHTSEAFDRAYKYLYNLLPDCRNCNCA